MEKRKECNIVQDLLLNYIDEVVSQDSKDFIEQHLTTCSECTKKLNNMKKDMEESKQNNEEKEIEYLKNVKKKISKKNKIIIISGIILFLIILINVVVFVDYNQSIKTMKIYLEDNITSEQLESIKKVIKEQDSNIDITYNSKENELENLKEKLGEKSNLLNTIKKDNNILPASIEIEAKIDTIKSIQEIVAPMEGVKKVHSYLNCNPYEAFIYKIISSN